MATLATLAVKLVGDSSGLASTFSDVESRAQRMGGKMQSVGKGLSVGVTLPLVALGKSAVDAFAKQEQAMAQTEAVIKSTGGAANVTSDHVNKLASSLQQTTTFGDEATIAGANLLLTFKNIRNEAGAGNDVFDQSTKIMLDMSQAMGQDMQSSAIMLGKALNDPTTGLTALSRVGITFTDQQEEQIKAMQAAGDMAGAQKLILKELESQFGGTAEAIAQTDSGKFTQAMNRMGDSMEQVGAVIAPVLAKIANVAANLIGIFDKMPGPVKEILVGFLALAAAAGPLLFIGGKLLSNLRTVISVVGLLGKALTFFAANPIVLVIAAVALVAVLIVKHWDKIKAVTMAVFGAIAAFFKAIWNVIKTVFKVAIQTSIVGLVIAHWDKIKAVTEAVFGAIAAFFKAVWEKIVGFVKFYIGIYKAVLTAAWNAIRVGVSAAWGAITGAISGAWDAITGAVRRAIDTLKGIITGLWEAIARGVEAVKRVIIGAFEKAFAVVQKVIDGAKRAAEFLLPFSPPPLAVGAKLSGDAVRHLAAEFSGLERKIPSFDMGRERIRDGVSLGSEIRAANTRSRRQVGTVVNQYVRGSVLSQRELVDLVRRKTSRIESNNP